MNQISDLQMQFNRIIGKLSEVIRFQLVVKGVGLIAGG